MAFTDWEQQEVTSLENIYVPLLFRTDENRGTNDSSKATRDLELKPVLELIIAWKAEADQRYPDFEFTLQFRQRNHGLEYSLHFEPKIQGVNIYPDCDFPTRQRWTPLKLFYGEYPGGANNEVEFLFLCYPTQDTLIQRRRNLEIPLKNLL